MIFEWPSISAVLSSLQCNVNVSRFLVADLEACLLAYSMESLGINPEKGILKICHFLRNPDFEENDQFWESLLQIFPWFLSVHRHIVNHCCIGPMHKENSFGEFYWKKDRLVLEKKWELILALFNGIWNFEKCGFSRVNSHFYKWKPKRGNTFFIGVFPKQKIFMHRAYCWLLKSLCGKSIRIILILSCGAN